MGYYISFIVGSIISKPRQYIQSQHPRPSEAGKQQHSFGQACAWSASHKHHSNSDHTSAHQFSASFFPSSLSLIPSIVANTVKRSCTHHLHETIHGRQEHIHLDHLLNRASRLLQHRTQVLDTQLRHVRDRRRGLCEDRAFGCTWDLTGAVDGRGRCDCLGL